MSYDKERTQNNANRGVVAIVLPDFVTCPRWWMCAQDNCFMLQWVMRRWIANGKLIAIKLSI